MEFRQLKESFVEEMNSLESANRVMYSNQDGNNYVRLDEIDLDDNTINLYLMYYRKYFTAEATLKSGAKAGWSRENKTGKGVPINVEMVFPDDNYDNTNVITLNGCYRGQQMRSEIEIKLSDNEVTLKKVSNDIESRTVTNALNATFDIIRIKIANCLEDLGEM